MSEISLVTGMDCNTSRLHGAAAKGFALYKELLVRCVFSFFCR